jgi:hypothetical protein
MKIRPQLVSGEIFPGNPIHHGVGHSVEKAVIGVVLLMMNGMFVLGKHEMKAG